MAVSFIEDYISSDDNLLIYNDPSVAQFDVVYYLYRDQNILTIGESNLTCWSCFDTVPNTFSKFPR